ncbi:MAG: type II toxin-antitoxin system HicA family toxin [Ignavibacteriaceae bacterium]
MPRDKKIVEKILSGKSDANINFNDLINFLLSLGFEVRTRGSHNIFRKDGIEEKINLQKDGNNAKPYQIKQIRNILLRYSFLNPEE